MKFSHILGGILCHIIPPTALVLLYLHLVLPYVRNGNDIFAAILVGLIAWIVLYFSFGNTWGEIIEVYMRDDK